MQRMHAARWQDSGPQWQLSQDITFGYCSMPTSIGCWPRTRWCPSGLVELPDFHAHVMSQLPRAASGQKALWSLLPLNTFPRLFHKVRGVSPLKSVPQDWLSAPSFLQFYPSPCSCYRGQSHFTATDGRGSLDANVIYVRNFKHNLISAWHLLRQKANPWLSPFCFLFFTLFSAHSSPIPELFSLLCWVIEEAMSFLFVLRSALNFEAKASNCLIPTWWGYTVYTQDFPNELAKCLRELSSIGKQNRYRVTGLLSGNVIHAEGSRYSITGLLNEKVIYKKGNGSGVMCHWSFPATELVNCVEHYQTSMYDLLKTEKAKVWNL